MPAAEAFPLAGQTVSPRLVRLCLAGLVVYALALSLPYLGSAPLASHEALVGMRTRSLVSEGGGILPYTLYPSTEKYPLGRPDVRKPPLPFWVAGALASVTGEVNEWTIRLPSVPASIGTMLLLVFWMRRVVGWRTALVTGLATVTSAAALVWSRRAEVDMQLCFWTTLALTAFWFGLDEPSRRRQIRWALVMWVALGLSILAKGPMPVAFWAIGGPLYAVVTRQAQRLGGLLPLAGPLVMLTVVAPWVVLVMVRLGGEGMSAADVVSAWYQQSFGRYAGEFGHEKPFYYYIPRAPVFVLPWVLPLAIGVFIAFRRQALSARARWFLLLWGVGGLIMLSFGTGKRLHYALPVAPPLLAFTGLGLDYLLFGLPQRLPRAARWIFTAHWFGVPLVLAAAVVVAALRPRYELPLALLGVLGACGLAVVLSLYRDGRRVSAFLCFAAVLLVAVVIGTPTLVIPMMTEGEEGAALGSEVAARAAAPDDIAFFGPTDDTILFYARRNGPVFDDPADIVRWLEAHPRGLVVSKKGPAVDQLREACRLVPLPRGEETTIGRHTTSVILILSSDAPAAPSGTEILERK